MDKKKLGELIRSFDEDIEVNEGKQFIEITVAPPNLKKLAKQLRDNEEMWFDFLFCLSGIDYGNELGVVYHMRSTRHNHTIVVKTRISDREKPVLETVSDIWKTAEFNEREVYDLLGIRFNNHPDLRRFFLDSSSGYPLRKDYVDDINIVTK